MNLHELASAVPARVHDGRRYFVCIRDIPDPLQGKLVEALRGSACPVLPGEGPLAFAWDWQTWMEDRWTERHFIDDTNVDESSNVEPK